MGIEARVICDSVSPQGKRITTLQLKFHRFILPEFNTHRLFSRNASSSRAIPVAKMIEHVRNDPAMPIHWGKNQAGMQAREELTGSDVDAAKALWLEAAENATDVANAMNNFGVHKQVVNRLLEPFQWIHVVVTATEWDNFFMLRDHPAAQPEIQELARLMKKAMNESIPKELVIGEWHLPYVTDKEVQDMIYTNQFNNAIKCSAARCARVSYIKHDGQLPSIEDDLELYNMLVTRPYTDKRGTTYGDNDPIHASPIEHQATPAEYGSVHSGNFVGWIQYRKVFEEVNK